MSRRYRKPIQLSLVISKSRGPVRNVRYTCTIRLTSLLLVYYPRDPCPVSLCVRLNVSVRSRCSIQRDGRIDLVFGTEASFDQSYTVIRKFRYLEKYEYFPLELFPKLRTCRKFRRGYRLSKRVVKLPRERWTLRALWTGLSFVN